MIFVLALFEETFAWQRFEGEKKTFYVMNTYILRCGDIKIYGIFKNC